MQSSIGKKIFMMIMLSLLVIFFSLFFFISDVLLRDKRNQVEYLVKKFAFYNTETLLNHIGSVKLTVSQAARNLEMVDPEAEDARSLCEGILKDMFENNHVYNTWAVYEPDALDGKDALHKQDYPGAPSGRFIRSYIKGEDGIVLTADTYESHLSDPERALWYLQPMSTKEKYIDIQYDDIVLHDYGTKEGEQNAVTISFPILRDGEFIGCVGADILYEDLITSIDTTTKAHSVLMSKNGSVIYAKGSTFLNDTLQTLRFDHLSEIEQTFADNAELFLFNEYSSFLGTHAVTFFKPIYIPDFDQQIYLYSAMPEDIISADIETVLRPIILSLVTALSVSFIILAYLTHHISKPIKRITAAADAISQGNLNAEIAVKPGSRDEIGVLSRSLNKMISQFRVYIATQEQSGELLRLHSELAQVLYDNDNPEGAFRSMMPLLCNHFNVSSACLVLLENEKAAITARYDRQLGEEEDLDGKDFIYHSQVSSLLNGKTCFHMNTFSMEMQKPEFLRPETKSFCLLPIRMNDKLRGYLILESADCHRAFFTDETAFCFISNTISSILAQQVYNYESPVKLSEETLGEGDTAAFETEDRASLKNGRQEAAEEDSGKRTVIETGSKEGPETKESSFLIQLREIEEIDIDRGLGIVGDSEEDYQTILRVFTNSLQPTMEKLDDLLYSDLGSFAIEIHGLKGALNNIGAGGLGTLAFMLEKTAKAGDLEYCIANITAFSRKLTALQEKLVFLFRDQEDNTDKEKGDLAALQQALENTAKACEFYNSLEAAQSLEGVKDYTYEETVDKMLSELIDCIDRYEFDEAGTLAEKIKKYLEGMEDGGR